MLRRTYSILAAALLAAFSLPAFAQNGEYSSYSPYSIFAVGNLTQAYSAYNYSMGGVGVASRNHRYLNTVNPAAVAVRDSLALMIDFSVFNTNTIYSQTYGGNTYRSANNNTNIGGFAVSFPIWNKLAMDIGLRPYSSTGYTFSARETDPHVIAGSGNIKYSGTGQGSLYNAFGGLSLAIGKRLSVGAEAEYIFGKIEKSFAQDFVSSGYNEVRDDYTLTLNAFTGKFGMQYEQPIGKEFSLTFGATYQLAARVGGFNDYSHYSAGSVQNIIIDSYADTLRNVSPAVYLADELGVGVAFNFRGKFRGEFNYLRSDWTRSGMDSAKGFSVSGAPQSFATSVRESFRAGFEYIPNPTDVRYYGKRIAYRAGAYYNKDYYTVAGNAVNSAGITLGATLPVFRMYNGLTVLVDIGQRGPFNGSLVRENYFRVGFGVSLFDIWFQQPRYN